MIGTIWAIGGIVFAIMWAGYGIAQAIDGVARAIRDKR